LAQFQVGETKSIESLELMLATASECRLTGTLHSASAQERLAQEFGELHDVIQSQKLAEFKVDVRALTFVNSSAIRLFVDWVSRAEAAGYKLHFMTDRAITWHRLSFSVLKSLAPNSVAIVEHTAAEAKE
jgi:hypothetical protein